MDHNTILSRLDNGWELANRGNGWWLSEPRIPYRRTESIQIEDQIVNDLEKAGLVALDIPYRTLIARRTSQAPDFTKC